VTGPLRSFAPLLGSQVTAVLARYRAAPASRQRHWAATYVAALATISPHSSGRGMMATTSSPNYAKLGSLHGDFGPVPVMARADLRLAQDGHPRAVPGRA